MQGDDADDVFPGRTKQPIDDFSHQSSEEWHIAE